jgi:sugar lactone lactonase YvrE
MKTLRRAVSFAILAIGLLAPSRAWAHPGSGIVIDRLGQIYFLDTGSGLWKIDRTGKLTRISTENLHWLAIDEENALARVPLPSGSRGDVRRVGSRPSLLVASDYPLVMGDDEALYYPLIDGTAGVQLMRVAATGRTTVFASVRPRQGLSLNHLNGIARGLSSALYFTEDDAIRRVDARGAVSTIIDRVRPSPCASIPGNGDSPLLRGLAVDALGVIYAAASGCGSVLKIMPDGHVTTLIQTQSPWSPTAVAVFGGDVYVLEYLHTEAEIRSAWIPRVRRVRPDGTSTIVATVTR